MSKWTQTRLLDGGCDASASLHVLTSTNKLNKWVMKLILQTLYKCGQQGINWKYDQNSARYFPPVFHHRFFFPSGRFPPGIFHPGLFTIMSFPLGISLLPKSFSVRSFPLYVFSLLGIFHSGLFYPGSFPPKVFSQLGPFYPGFSHTGIFHPVCFPPKVSQPSFLIIKSKFQPCKTTWISFIWNHHTLKISNLYTWKNNWFFFSKFFLISWSALLELIKFFS